MSAVLELGVLVLSSPGEPLVLWESGSGSLAAGSGLSLSKPWSPFSGLKVVVSSAAAAGM